MEQDFEFAFDLQSKDFQRSLAEQNDTKTRPIFPLSFKFQKGGIHCVNRKLTYPLRGLGGRVFSLNSCKEDISMPRVLCTKVHCEGAGRFVSELFGTIARDVFLSTECPCKNNIA